MKKIRVMFIIVFLYLILSPFVVVAETCEPDKITIESITINDKTDNVVENNIPTIDKRNINLDVKMSEVGDYIEYKMMIKNDSSEDYELDKNSLKINSEYVEYTLETNDDSQIIKSGQTRKVLLTVQYKKEVRDESFIDGVYTDNKELKVNLETGNTLLGVIQNPNTGQKFIIIAIILLIIGIMFVVLRKRNKKKEIIMISIITLIIPISINAICKCDININSNIVIDKTKYFCIFGSNIKFQYMEQMTFYDWYNSPYYDSRFEDFYINAFESYDYENCMDKLEEKYANIDKSAEDFDWGNYDNDRKKCGDYINSEDKIRSNKDGCYKAWAV